jgi:uncharacterized protein YjbJ (UPF0337 family)
MSTRSEYLLGRARQCAASAAAATDGLTKARFEEEHTQWLALSEKSESSKATNIKGVTRMNWDRVEGNWNEFKGKVQQQWGKLTNDDLEVVKGKRTELAGRLQQRYGYAKDQAEREIDTWLRDTT